MEHLVYIYTCLVKWYLNISNHFITSEVENIVWIELLALTVWVQLVVC